MTITVHGPGGITINFPDGTDHATIDGAMRQALGQSTGQSLQDRFATAFDASPDSQPTQEGLDAKTQRGSIADPLIQGVTFGFGDEIAGGIGGLMSAAEGKGFQPGYEKVRDAKRADLQAYRERHPIVAPVAEIAGALPTAALPVGAVARGASLGAKVGLGALAGAGQGALYGAGAAEGGPENRAMGAVKGAAVGGAIGGALPIVGNVAGKVIGSRAASAATPTATDMAEQARTLYKTAEDMGVAIKPQSFSDAMDSLLTKLQAAGINPKQQPKSFETFRILLKARDAGDRGLRINLKDVEQLRQIAGAVLKDQDANERRVSHMIVDGIDDFMGNLKGSDITGLNSGSARQAVDLIRNARELWSRKSKAEILQKAFERATNRTSANYTSAGMQTALRQEFKAIAQNDRAMRRFNKAERAAIMKVVRGGKLENALRFIGKFAPTGYLTGAGTVGVGLANPAVGAAGAAGTLAARHAAARMAIKNARNADLIVRSGQDAVPFDAARAAAAEAATNRVLGTFGRAAAPQLVSPFEVNQPIPVSTAR